MATTPKRHLPSSSEPWGRSVDDQLRSLSALVSRNSQDTTNTLKGLNSALTTLAGQVEAIASAQARATEAIEKLSGLRTQVSDPVDLMEFIAAGDGARKIFPSNTTLTVEMSPNTQLLVTICGDMTAAPRGTATARGDLFVAGASFELEGSADYYFGSNNTTASLKNQVLEDGEVVSTATSVTRSIVVARRPGTYTLRAGLIGYKSVSGEDAIIAANNMILIAQIIPGDGF